MSKQLSKAILKRGTIIKAAKDIGIHQNSLSKYMDGETNPSVDTAIKIAEYLGVSVEWLFSDNPSNMHNKFEIPGEMYNEIFSLGIKHGEDLMRAKMMEIMK